jgi:thiamine pyrophosphokinase
MTARIVGDSPDFEVEFLEKMAGGFDVVFVTDGAIHKVPAGVYVSVVCGDFDSIDMERARRERPQVEFVSLPDQEMNDVEKALLLAEQRGAREICFVSILGGKFDQSCANLSVMIRHHKRIQQRAYHAGTWVWIVSGSESHPGRLQFESRSGDAVSIAPMSHWAHVRAENVKWPLRHEELRAGSRGVSNEALGGAVEIEVTEGIVVVTAAAHWSPQ